MNVSGISQIGLEPSGASHVAPSPRDGSGFSRALNDLLGGASAQDAQASQALEQLAQGKTDNLHTVALAAARADLSFRLVLEIRNRLQAAYQEVMRMQV
jgi:flagellar hook-basal body complex protein FliE